MWVNPENYSLTISLISVNSRLPRPFSSGEKIYSQWRGYEEVRSVQTDFMNIQISFSFTIINFIQLYCINSKP